MSPQAFATAEDVIAEMNSGYGNGMSGPIKEINEIVLVNAETHAPSNTLTARIGIGAFRQDLYDAMSSSQRDFTVGLEVLGQLAERAPRFRPKFSKMFTELATRLAQEHAAYREGVNDWCDKGLPTQQATTIMRALRLKTSR